jgi:tetratricopeptide (TPR) repeat protein
MKKIYLLAMLGVAFGFTACDDKLDIEQKASLTTETFYKSDEDAEKALASAYEQFQSYTMGRAMGPGIYTPARVLANHPGDDVNYGGSMYGDHEFGGSVDEFRFKHTPEAIDYHYDGLYISVYSDNLVIENFEKIENPSKFMKQAIAEARVLRAYNYFLLSTYWGQPPFVTQTISMSDTPTNSEMTRDQYFVWVAEECENAVPDLLVRESPNDKEGAYRVTQGFALALAGKAYMFAGNFAKAKDCFKKVIDSGKYELVSGDDWCDLFHIQGDGAPEKVFEVNLRYNPGAGEWSTGSGLGWNQHDTWMEPQCFQIRSGYFKKPPLANYAKGCEGWGSIGLPKWYADAFVENDGLESKRLNATMINIENLVYAETGNELIDHYADAVWKKFKISTHEEKLTCANIGIESTTGHYGQSFWIPMKHVIRDGDCTEDGNTYGSNHRLNNIIIMRYAEVLLDYAECCIRTGQAAEAGTYIKMIQERAGSKTVLTGDPTLIDLKKEKSFELWFEGCRYQDVMRWTLIDNDAYDQEALGHMKVQGTHIPHLYDKVFRPVEASDVDVLWQHSTDGSDPEDRFYIAHTHEAQDAGYQVGWQEKHRLFPYPQKVMDMNPNIVQNPGW